MIHIQKGSEPTVLRNYKRTHGAKANYADFTEKDALKNQLLEEQGYLCAYCMGHIGSDKKRWWSEVGIEHYKCQEEYKELELDYENMLAVCKISKGKRISEQHCDVSKGGQSLHFNPQIKGHIETLTYSEGELLSKVQEYNMEVNDILGLNRGYLPSNRRDILNDAVLHAKKFIGLYGNNNDTLTRILKIYNNTDKYGRKKPYCGIVITYFHEKISRI
ncbi:hypothetical protein [Paenibacillus sp. P46E]|uniref:hypothetical protein n=1 Tax=Paenibacillus sp. P46E TaxID=1349436 RepID=UPI00093A6E67|nr:hypothetical protein [Paenibacillus sp. P46E]OKP95026.1 hypothetical protein A3849_28155 [Paenibacillus sp. P46E]